MTISEETQNIMYWTRVQSWSQIYIRKSFPELYEELRAEKILVKIKS